MTLTPEFLELAPQVRNWGRWGDDDEIGTLNLITPEVRRRAAASVRSGRAFSLAMPLDEVEGIQVGVIEGRNNPVHRMTVVNGSLDGGTDAFTSDDAVDLSLQAATHWDGLGHVSYGGHLYNGYPADSIDESGATRCGIHRIASLTSRGVLLDVARVKDVDVLEAGYPITAADLDAAAEAAGVTVESGDVVLVRTGQAGLLPDKWAYTLGGAGLTLSTAAWFHAHDVAAVATDSLIFEVYPFEGDMTLPVHLLHLVEMGMTQGQNWVLDVLAADCADDGQYDFLLEASPLPFVRAVGSPVNPVAVK
jgi:kynurenine formamidase